MALSWFALCSGVLLVHQLYALPAIRRRIQSATGQRGIWNCPITSRKRTILRLCRCGCSQKAASGIVDGSKLTTNDYPWVVSIAVYFRPSHLQGNGTGSCYTISTKTRKLRSARSVGQGQHVVSSLCGGAVITRRHVLTAGHCLLPGELKPRYIIRYGSAHRSLQATAFVSKVYKHPNCHLINADRAVDDAAVLVLHADLPVTPVCLPQAGAPLPPQVAVAGWGNTIPSVSQVIPSDLLKIALLNVISKEQCQREHSYADLHDQICAESVTGFPAGGDSGGPVMSTGPSGEWTLVGIVSWGNETRFRTSPSVFTDVGALLSWIQDVVALPA